MPPIPAFQTTCNEKRLIAPGVYQLSFTKPEGFTFVAGQYVLFEVPLIDNPKDIQVRAYSIASTPTDADLLFVIKLVPNGRASAWIEKTVQAGTVVTMRGPLGVLSFGAGDKPVICVATGTGVAPFHSLIRAALDAGDKRRIDLYFGVKSEGDVFWKEEWQALETKSSTVHVHVSTMDGTANWHGEKGMIQDLVCGRLKEGAASLYLCGAPDIVKLLKDECENAWKIPKEDVHVESFV